MTQIPREKSREIWNMYVMFENSYGDLSTLTKVEKRKAEIYPEPGEGGILSLVNRYRHNTLWPCSQPEFNSFGTC